MWASRGGVLWEETLALAYARCLENISEGGGKGGIELPPPAGYIPEQQCSGIIALFYFCSSLKDSPG